MSKIKIAIDIGHGENTYRDTGGKGVPQMAEFEFNNAVGKYAKELAELNGFDVLMTQPIDGDDTSLSTRTNLAIRERVDLLISIHADANGSSAARGHWLFYWEGHMESKKVAEIWSKHANRLLENPDRGVRESQRGTWSSFHMCRVPTTNQFYTFPSILCEHAFMTNAQDLQLLLSDDFRRKCAEVLVRTACEYFNKTFISQKEVILKMVSKYFKDLSANHWGTMSAERMYKRGLLKGDVDGQLNPKEPISKIETVVLLDRVVEYILKEMTK